MQSKKELFEALSTYKVARDALIHAGDDEFAHHLKEFVKELDRNPLCRQVVATVPAFDVNAWLSAQVGEEQHRPVRLDSLDLPEDRNARLAIYLDFVRSFASEDRRQLSVEQFGMLFGKHKRSEARALAQSLVLHPLSEQLDRQVREIASMVNPDVRELAGVPLAQIPGEKETGVFLSHKSSNKDIVRRYHRVLHEMGFDPWLDEKEIVAGDVLHRALAKGMEESCAAVFFVTSEFRDERWLGQELDLAVTRRIERGSKFQIITLVFGSAEVPKPLQQYVYSKVDHDLDGLTEIVRALPIELGPARWKATVVGK